MAGRRSFLVRFVLGAVLFFTVSISQAQAADIPVIIKLQAGGSISTVINALNGTLIDSIPGSDMYLVNLSTGGLLQSISGLIANISPLLGVEWVELNTGVTQPSYFRLGILRASGAADWYKNQPSF